MARAKKGGVPAKIQEVISKALAEGCYHQEGNYIYWDIQKGYRAETIRGFFIKVARADGHQIKVRKLSDRTLEIEFLEPEPVGQLIADALQTLD